MNYIEQVAVFHKQFEQPILEFPTIPLDRWKLRVSLLKEEVQEIEDACVNNDIIGVLDGAGDTMYVLAGLILEFGLKNVFEDAFNEIQRSNLSKACDTRELAESTKHWYATQGVETYIKPVEEKWNVYRLSDNKVLKSIYYFPANLAQFVQQ